MSEDVEHICIVCGWKYDQKKYGKWKDLPNDFECPECGSEKDSFEIIVKEN